MIEDEVDERAERVVLEEEFERFTERRRLAPRFRSQAVQQRVQQSFHFGGSGGRRRSGGGIVWIEDPAESMEQLLGGYRCV